MDERYTEHVSTESPELIRANECEYNIGTLVTYRFRRLWNEIVDLREQLDAARRTTPDREAIIEECAKVCDDRIMGDKSEGDFEAKRCAEAIRSLKTAPTSDKRGA